MLEGKGRRNNLVYGDSAMVEVWLRIREKKCLGNAKLSCVSHILFEDLLLETKY